MCMKISGPEGSLVIAAVEDIFFSAMIESSARNAGVEVKIAVDSSRLNELLNSTLPRLIILDLNGKACAPLEAVTFIKAEPRLAGVPVIGFFSHVQVELETAARAAGCDRVLPRSAFVRSLPQILTSAVKSEQ
jgi:CheY-like chemotaxis protein